MDGFFSAVPMGLSSTREGKGGGASHFQMDTGSSECALHHAFELERVRLFVRVVVTRGD